ncbi:MAG TPA: DNA-formamidopyrimidine glycosylase [Firmicutes bacterium]|nr:DNA-formamidopyrimidine glycosylase [Bacillota bacterium]
MYAVDESPILYKKAKGAEFRMPELPEVETVKRTLAPEIEGKEIIGVEVFLAKAVKPRPEIAEEFLPGRVIQKVTRRGKYLILTLDSQVKVAFHLRMTGQLLYQPRETPLAKHTTLRVSLNDGFDLRMVDQRKFGTINIFAPDGAGLAPCGLLTLGPEPFDVDALFSLKKAARRRKGPVKGVLLDQQVLAGLGNIYTDEALFRAGINPARPANSLTEEEWTILYEQICRVLTEGINHRGTTRRDYVDGRGQPGGYQKLLKVYGRKRMACLVCGEPIKYARIAGRGSHFCPHCQK